MSWMQTLKGRAFDLVDIYFNEFDIEEIAHALAMQCRFNGHVNQLYSVAQHSVLVSCLLEEWGEPRETVFAGLMHDAAEAYVGDLIQPLKLLLDEYREIEEDVTSAITRTYGLPVVLPAVVKKADIVMLLVERRDLKASPPKPWFAGEEDIELPKWGIGPEIGWRDAKRLFLDRFYELTGDP